MLHIVLAGALIVLVLIFAIIGFYVITILSLVKKVLSQVEFIAFNLSHLRAFAKLGVTKSILKLFDLLKKGGGDYGKPHGYAS